jgi:DNA helicase-2/ATP-dependent DNA helicase PcrA
MNNQIKYSDEQNAIFNWFRTGRGNGVIRARAGTGKTFTIIAGFEEAPDLRMLYAVFNKKNQIEAEGKIKDPRVTTKTLHAVGFQCIKRVWPKAKPYDMVEIDRIKSLTGNEVDGELVSTTKKLVGFGKNLLIDPTLDELIEIAETRLIAWGECDDDKGPKIPEIAELALAVMELSKTQDPENRISFNDMVWLPVAMGWVAPMYDLVCVDEAQDMNLPQLEMVRQSAKASGRVCVVGDDRQAIYGFRGAAQNGIDMMKKALNADEFKLTTTYRCPKRVVAIARDIVPDYQAALESKEGEVLEVSGDLTTHAIPGDVILSRINAPLVPLCLAFLKKGIRARIEGKDVAKALEAILRRLKARSVPEFLSKLESWRKKMVARFINQDGERSEGQISIINDQSDMLRSLSEDAVSVTDISNRLQLLFVENIGGSDLPTVTLSSVHKAKGLEWNRVFLLRSTFMKKRILEEENIFYVAITRAKQSLHFYNA